MLLLNIDADPERLEINLENHTVQKLTIKSLRYNLFNPVTGTVVRTNEITRTHIKDMEDTEKISSNKIIMEFINQLDPIADDFLIVCDGPDWMRQFLHPISLSLDL